jgi:hypothetical protein
VVAVGPTARRDQPTAILRAPAHVEFTPGGESRAQLVTGVARRERPSSGPVPRRAEPVSSNEPSPETPPETPALPSALTIGEVEASMGPLIAAIGRCFEDNTDGSGNVRVTAQTNVTLDVDPDGTVLSAAFTPPLSPNAQACSEREAHQARFPRAEKGSRITRVLELSR